MRKEVKMLIYCPKCKTGYEIDERVVPEQGRRLRCAVCKKVFKCMPADLIDGSKLRTAEFTEEEKKHLDEQGHLKEDADSLSLEEKSEEPQTTQENEQEETKPEEKSDSAWEEEVAGAKKTLDELASDNQYVKDIFQRLSTETENLFQADKEEPQHQKIWFRIKKALGIVNPKHILYYIYALLAFLLLFLYYARYELVRSFPELASVYKTLGIEAVVAGEGLEFQNVVRREFEDDFVPKIEIKGFIANKMDVSIDIPKIRIELLDKDGRAIQSENFDSVIPLVTAKSKVPFSHVISRPSPLSKYIYLTFINPPPEEKDKKK